MCHGNQGSLVLFLLTNGLLHSATAAPAFCSHNLEVLCAQVQANIRPSVEMIRDGDSTAATSRSSDGNVLVEGRSSLDGRLVDTLVLIDRVA